jgi:hypothetical protein
MAMPIRPVKGPRPDSSLDDRVRNLEREVREIDERVHRTQTDLEKEIEDRQASIGSEHWLRQQADADIKRALQASERGDLHLSAIGLWWLGIGLTFSTLPQEILRWLGLS